MSTLYLITGPAGVGKSTISNMLANSLNKSILIEGDYVYHLVQGGYISPWKEGNHLKLFWENSLSLIENSLKQGYDVVFNYILHQSDIANIKNKFKNYEIKFAGLTAKEQIILNRDKLRSPENQMGERCLVLLESFNKQNFNKKNIIDTSQLKPEEIVEKILKDNNFII